MNSWTEHEKMLVAGLWALPGAGAVSIDRILAVFGDDVRLILDRPFDEWLPELALPHQAGDLIEAARLAGMRSAQESAERMFERCRATGTKWCYRGDPEYPALLAALRSMPQVLFYRGRGAVDPGRFCVAMVGTREAEPKAFTTAREFAAHLATNDVTIVSGAARGTDTSCHLGALDVGGQTWAVLGSALDQMDYHPRQIVRSILERGGSVFSEYPPGVRADNKSRFPKRNRLISGSSDLTVVCRAPLGSGALHTSTYAVEQGRPVMAIPGEVGVESAEGSNQLLQKGALPCLSAGDIARALGIAGKLAPIPNTSRGLPDDAGDDVRKVFDVLEGKPMDFDTLIVASGLTSGQVSAALTQLELAEAVRINASRVYSRA